MARDNRRSRDAQAARQTASRGKSQREIRPDNRKPASESDRKALQSQRASQNSPAETRNRRAKKNNNAKKKVVIKKRFFVFCIIFVLLIAAIIFLSVKTIHNVMMMNNNSDQVTATLETDSSESGGDTGNNDAGDTTAETASTSSGSSTADENGYQPAIMTQDPVSDQLDEEGNPVAVNLTQEQQIRAAILGSWYISPIAQTREYVESVFGKLIRYEDWNGGAYYHRGFPETMYVNYRGDKGEDDLPTMDSICCTVSIVMKRIIEFEEFKPNSAVWGEVHEDPSGEGWSNYYYYILIKDNLTLKVYCDKDGNIDKETHIIVHRL